MISNIGHYLVSSLSRNQEAKKGLSCRILLAQYLELPAVFFFLVLFCFGCVSVLCFSVVA